jgi:type VI secretion system protein ImpA
MSELEALLAEVEPEQPCGPDLDAAYDAEFLELVQAVQGKLEQQFGNTIIPAVEPIWFDVGERASSLLARSKDIRVAVQFTRALAHTQGLPGFCFGLQVIHGLLARYWDSVHPRLETDGDAQDPTMRLNALASLVDNETLLRDLHSALFIQSRQHGKILVRDVEIAVGKLPASAEQTTPSLSLIENAIRKAGEDGERIIEAVRGGARSTALLSDILVEKVGARAIDLSALADIFASLADVCERALPGAAINAAEAVSAEGRAAEGDASSDSLSAPVAVSAVRSRKEAIHMLDMVCQYLALNEPTNPAPLLIRRGKRLMTMTFVEIIQDLAPESIAQIQGITGTEKE